MRVSALTHKTERETVKIVIELDGIGELCALRDILADIKHPAAPDETTSLDKLRLEVRTTKLLKSQGIQTLGALLDQSETDLLQIPGFGRRKCNEVREVLEELGLRLADDELPETAPPRV